MSDDTKRPEMEGGGSKFAKFVLPGHALAHSRGSSDA